MAVDIPKVKNLILRILQEYGEDGIELSHLYNLMAIIDRSAYAELGHSITGLEYVKVPEGFEPV